MKETQIKACDAAECIIALDEWLSFVLGALFSTSAVCPQPVTMGRRGSCPSPRQERRQQRGSWPSRRAAGRRGKLSLCRRKDARLLSTTLLLAPHRLDNTSSLLQFFLNPLLSFSEQVSRALLLMWQAACTVTKECVVYQYAPT